MGYKAGVKATVPLLLALWGCTDTSDMAGLSGSNPIVGISYRSVPIDPVPDYTVAVDVTGRVRFKGGQWTAAKGEHQKQLNPITFVQLAEALGEFRRGPGMRRTIAQGSTKCITDAGSQLITWAYKDGRVERLLVQNCFDDETRKLAPVLISLPDRLKVRQWIG